MGALMTAYEDNVHDVSASSLAGPLVAAQPAATEEAGAGTDAARVEAVLVDDNTPCVLLVDDEPGVLSALRRLLRPTGYRVFTAESAAAALELLASVEVDVVVSDMRMPNMNGAEFLAAVKALYPDTVRILLTGYSELDSAVHAINEGGVYHYLNKPWDDQELLLTLRNAVEQRALQREAARLTELTRQQNAALREFNTELEVQVHARTEEIRQTVLFLEDAQHDLKNNFATMVQVCANMIELRCGAVAGQSTRVADLARQIALALGMSGLQAQDVFYAGLLHGIGKLALPDELLRKSLDRLSPEELQLFYQHPLRAQMVLTPVTQLAHVAQIIRQQYERYNGRGLPDGLIGEDIVMGARILALARDFEGLCSGGLVKDHVTPQKAAAMIRSQSGLRYDPLVVERFFSVLEERAKQAGGDPLEQIQSGQLREGMRLADDLRTGRGVLLMTRGSVVNAHQIEQIRRFEAQEDKPFTIVVYRPA